MKILITGGHLTPALSFIDFVQKHRRQDSLVFVGREYSQDTLQQEAVERYEVEKRKVLFIPFQAVRIGVGFFWRLPTELKQFLVSVRQARALLEKHKPDVVLSFGGYVAVPFALAAKKLKISLVTHEQTLTVGFANKLIGMLADTVAVAFPQTEQDFWLGKTVVTGNPLRDGVFVSRHSRPDWLPAKLTQPVVLVLGGNQGSLALNNVVGQSLAELLPRWTVIHQCGQPTSEKNYQEILERQKKRLPKDLQKNYFVKEWIDDEDLFWLYRHSLCALSRSGANATQEFVAAGLPAILVPLPMAHRNEQYKNAQWLSQAGGAILLDQSLLNTANIIQALEKISTFEHSMRESLQAISLPRNAAENLYEVVRGAVS